MKKFVLCCLALLPFLSPLGAQVRLESWQTDPVTGSKTGVKATSAGDVDETMGVMRGRTYIAPNGKKFRRGTTRKAARLMLSVQPQMAQVKEVIAYSTRPMLRTYPESELGNWTADLLLRIVADSVGRKVDIAITNKGSLRIDMPAGPVLYDDIMSMFPFKNNLVYLSLRGRDVRAILEQMAATRWQVVGGCRAVVANGKLVSVTVDGKPLDDNALYGVATNSFLLDGGDGFFLEKNAEEKIVCSGYVYDGVLQYVRKLTAAGRPIEYHLDERIVILQEGDNE